MERFLKDFFATADEQELAEFEPELERIIKSCPDEDAGIISRVNERAVAEGEPLRASAPLKKKTALPAVVAAVLTIALFAGIFSRLGPQQRSGPEAPPTAAASSEDSVTDIAPNDSEGGDALSYEDTMALQVYDFFDACCVAAGEGMLSLDDLPFRGFVADLDAPDSMGYKTLMELKQKLEQGYSTLASELYYGRGLTYDIPGFFSAETDRDGVVTVHIPQPELPESGRLYVYITPDLTVAIAQWQPSANSPYASRKGERENITVIGFGEVVRPDMAYGSSASGTVYDSDAVPWEESGDYSDILTSFGAETEGLRVFEHPLRMSSSGRLGLMLAGYRKLGGYPFMELYLLAESTDGLPIIPDGTEYLETNISAGFLESYEASGWALGWTTNSEDPTHMMCRLTLPLPEGQSFEDMRNSVLTLDIGNITSPDEVYYYNSCQLMLVLLEEGYQPAAELSITKVRGDGTELGSLDADDSELREQVMSFIGSVVHTPAGISLSRISDSYHIELDPETVYYHITFGEVSVVCSTDTDIDPNTLLYGALQSYVEAGNTLYVVSSGREENKELVALLDEKFS